MKSKILLAAAAALVLAACDQVGGDALTELDAMDTMEAEADAMDVGVTREAVNPWEWGAFFGFNQGEVVSGETRTLYLAGQTSVDENGAALFAGDTRGQLGQALDNLDTVLGAADMDRSNVVRLTIFTTDVDGIIANWDIYMARYAEAGHTPPVTLIGIAQLFEPELVVEIEAVAVD